MNKGLLSKQRQESSETRMCFVPFQKTSATVDADLKSEAGLVKAISIQALSIKRFLILDSAGYIHVLHVSGRHPLGSNFACHMQQLPRFTDVQKLALLPETSVGKKNTLWVCGLKGLLFLTHLIPTFPFFLTQLYGLWSL